MPSVDIRQSLRSDSRSRSHTKRSHTGKRANQDHEGDTISHPRPSDRPATLEALRAARMKRIETPEVETSHKMKYAYTRKVAVKPTGGTSEVSSRQRSTKRTRRRRASQVSGEKKPASKHRSTEALGEDDNEDEEEYVYQSSRNITAAREGPVVDEPHDVEEASRPISRSATKTETRPRPRRHTTATDPKSQNTNIEIERPSPAISRPQLRKSTTTPLLARPFLRSSPSLDHTKSEVSSIRPPRGKKTSSVFGSLFPTRPPPLPEVRVSCLTCGDDVVKSRTAKLPCAHHMCQPCLKRLFKLSISDPAHMPPRCCTDQHIDLQHVDKLFENEFKRTWNRKFKEYKAKNRIYCPKEGCGTWIQPKHMTIDKGRRTGRCPTCKLYVCGICSQKMHKSRDCPKDPALKQFAEIAKQAGWQKCYNCSATVELKEGCNHMTCRCTAEFCMVCGLKWKSCDCPWFNYDQVNINGDPIRYQQELDRRREQEHRDEEIARRLEALDVDDLLATRTWGFASLTPTNNNARHRSRNTAGVGNNNNANDRNDNGVGDQANQNFFEQAREALTANYQVADQAARVILNGLFTGRELNEAEINQPPPPPSWSFTPSPPPTRTRRNRTNDPAEAAVNTTTAGIPVVRRQTRRTRQMANAQESVPSRVETEARREQERRMRRWADDEAD